MSTLLRASALLLSAAVLTACGTDDGASAPESAQSATSAAGSAVDGATDRSASDDAAATEEGSGDSAADDCAPADGPLVDVDATPGEPRLRLPQLAGWEPNTQLNSEMIRLALVNASLANEQFAPNVVVTAEPSPADVQAAFDRQFAAAEQGLQGGDVQATDGTICGHESKTFEYRLPAMGAVPERPAMVQIIVVPHGAETITYTITAQATDPVDPAYERDVRAMFEGVQITDAGA